MGTYMKQNRTFRLVLISIFTAIIILQNFVPFLGNIQIGAFSLTLMHITVIIVAIALGPLDGAIIGGIWGVITFIRAFTFPSSPIAPIIFTNPLISILPRIFIGVVAGYTYLALRKTKLFEVGSMSIAALLGALTNTVLVLGLTYVFFRLHFIIFTSMNLNADQVLPFLLGIVFTNGIFEAAAAVVVAPTISRILIHISQKN